jgi:hypothetical protein
LIPELAAPKISYFSAGDSRRRRLPALVPTFEFDIINSLQIGQARRPVLGISTTEWFKRSDAGGTRSESRDG